MERIAKLLHWTETELFKMWQCTFFPSASIGLFSLVFSRSFSSRPPNTREKRPLLTGNVLFLLFYIPVSKGSFYFRSLHREYKTKTSNSNHRISRSKMKVEFLFYTFTLYDSLHAQNTKCLYHRHHPKVLYGSMQTTPIKTKKRKYNYIKLYYLKLL